MQDTNKWWGFIMGLSEVEKLQQENEALRNELTQCLSKVNRLNTLDQVHEWSWEVDAQGVYTHVNDNTTDILGYFPQEMLGKSPFDFMNADEAKRVGGIFLEIVLQEKSFSKLLNTCIHKDGSTVYTETSGEPFYNHNGDFCGYRGIDFDRTKEHTNTKSLEAKNSSLTQALQNQNELLLNVTNSISDCIFYKDTEYKYIGCRKSVV